jgi:hypothetical protein
MECSAPAGTAEAFVRHAATKQRTERKVPMAVQCPWNWDWVGRGRLSGWSAPPRECERNLDPARRHWVQLNTANPPAQLSNSRIAHE